MSDIEDLEPERMPRGAAPSPGEAPAPAAPPPAATPGGRVRRRRFGVALAIAAVADLIQWVLWPLFMLGVASPVDDVLDLAVAAVMVRLVGWHWAFLPAFIAEIVPGVDLVPTWTLAVWIATRGKK